MKISVKVKPNAHKEKIKKIIDNKGNLIKLIISVSEKPINGMANKAVLKVLAKYFDVRPYNIILISGKTSKEKIFEIE